MALPRLVEVEGGSVIATGYTSAWNINGDEEYLHCDNGFIVIGVALMVAEVDETLPANYVVLFVYVENR